MSFWQNLHTAAGMGGAFVWVTLGFLVLSALLFATVQRARIRVRTSLLLFALSFGGLLVASALLSSGVGPLSASFRWIRWGSLLIQRFAIVNLASVLVFDVALNAIRLKPPRIMRDLLVAFAYIVVTITLLSASGVDLAGIVATSAVITAVIGLSFQDTLGNMMGGMALQLERAIIVGDWVRIDNQEGRVKEIRWRHTAIETRNWDTVVIPNSVLMKGQIIVLGRRAGSPRQHRQWVYFNVDFRYAPTEIIDTVETALRAEAIPNVAIDPPPNCVLMDFKESYGSYAVRYWLTDLALDDPTNSIVRSRIYFSLRRAGISLSIPAHSVFITEEGEQRRERKRDEEDARRIAALNRIELFQTLTNDEKRSLVPHLRIAPFVRGETITKQGAKAHWLYIINKGDAAVHVTVDGAAASERVAELHQGDFFGEMGMMTGEPRSATVSALTDVECYRLDKEAFDEILRSRPEIAEDISRILAQRRAGLEAIREGLTEEGKRARMRRHQGDLLNRIRNFFALRDA
jgi:small-conductance mechanosensitive channel/CRP-like cAMP-binding protein